jgi:O-succinylbenzoic acid--CoA ligase
LVPTQLHRVIAAADEGEPAALDALARCAGVLLGGAATPPALLRRAVAAGVPVRRTYGMSETAGGCVYDGVPLAGARIRLAAGGRVEIAGPMLASGYVGDPEATSAAFHDEGGERWFRTSDLGSLDPGGTLTILGRGDDVIISGGVNVTPAVVETVLAEVLPAILQVPAVEVCVVGVPDAEWGQSVVAVVAAPDIGAGPPTPVDPVTLAAVRAAVAGRLEAPPRRVYLTGSLPVRGPGKVDRKAVAAAIP